MPDREEGGLTDSTAMPPPIAPKSRKTVGLALALATVSWGALLGCGKAAGPVRGPGHDVDNDSIVDFREQLERSHRTGILASYTGQNGPAQTHWRPLFWNSWMVLDTDPASSDPVLALEPERPYRLHLDLSGIDYRAVLAKQDPGATAVAPAKASDKVIKLFDPTRPTVVLEVAILPNEQFFRRDPNDRWTGDITVKTADILKFDDAKAVVESPFVQPDFRRPAYRFGHMSFRLMTKQIEKPVTTSIGISMWANHRPVEELELLVCIDPSGEVRAGRCHLPVFRGDPAADAMAAALLDEDETPDAALHILRLADTRLVSLLRRGAEPLATALKWRLAPNDDGFYRSHVSRLTQINKAADSDLPNLGGHLLQDLFEYASDDVAQTRKDFVSYFAEELRNPPKGGRRRMIAVRAGLKDFVPLGLAALKVGERTVFLGDQFALDFPLPGARAHAKSRPRHVEISINGAPMPGTDPPSSGRACELPWVSVLPPRAGESKGAEDGTLLDARNHMTARKSPLLRYWEAPGDCTFTDMVAFREWANRPDAPTVRTGLFLLSHHDAARNMLFFSPAQDDLMSPDDFTRSFAPGSIAVLNACGTGNPAALRFIDALDRRGVDAVIATATEVKADMAADFSYCLARQIDSQKRAIELGDAFDRALDCLANLTKEGGGTYGARAYTYTLLGDRTLPVCRPPARRPSCKE
jgi:hypothetical protein